MGSACIPLLSIWMAVASADDRNKTEKPTAVDPAAIAGYARSLKDPDENVRRHAVEMLGKLGADAKFAIVPLITAFHDENEGVCEQAVTALSRIGADAIPELVKRLSSTEIIDRYYAVMTLGQMGHTAEPALDGVIARLKDDDVGVRMVAASTIGLIGSAPKRVLPILYEVLADRDLGVRMEAAESIGKLGVAGKESLVKALHDPSATVRRMGAYGLGLLGASALSEVPTLTRALGDEKKLVRGAAAAAIKKIDNAITEHANPRSR